VKRIFRISSCKKSLQDSSGNAYTGLHPLHTQNGGRVYAKPVFGLRREDGTLQLRPGGSSLVCALKGPAEHHQREWRVSEVDTSGAMLSGSTS
jgi:hypothetical protein